MTRRRPARGLRPVRRTVGATTVPSRITASAPAHDAAQMPSALPDTLSSTRYPDRTEVIAVTDTGPGAPPASGTRLGSSGWDAEITATVLYTRLEDTCAAEYPRLVRLLTLYCGDRDVALDLAQETCARGCAHWSKVSRMHDQRAWFTKVALNLSRSRWRRMNVERRAVAIVGARPAAAPERDVAVVVTVRAALAHLTPRQRAAVILRYFEDLDLVTAARVMRCSEGTVKKLTARGLETLKTLLDFDTATLGGHGD